VVLLQAQALDDADPQITYAIATLFVQQRQWERALPFAQRLVEMTPGQVGPSQLLENIRRQLEGSPVSR
jgi:hypothetical protein